MNELSKTIFPMFLGLACVAGSAMAQDRYGGSQGHFLVVQERPGTEIDVPGRCATHFAPLGGVVESVREAELVAPVVDRTTGTMDFEAAATAPVIGSISVCYRATTLDRDREAVAVVELSWEDDSLLLEAAGTCREYSVPHDTKSLFQSCTMHLTGPKANGVRSGTMSSGGRVPRGEPAASIRPNTWSIFVVRD